MGMVIASEKMVGDCVLMSEGGDKGRATGAISIRVSTVSIRMPNYIGPIAELLELRITEMEMPSYEYVCNVDIPIHRLDLRV